MSRVTNALALSLAVLFILAGAAETVRAIRSGDGGLWFWFGFLVGGGAAILVGRRSIERRPRLSLALVVLGSLAGALATAWTLLVPVAAVVLISLTLRDLSRPQPSAASETGSTARRP